MTTIIQREITSSFKKGIQQYPIVTLTGPRQSGKTFLSKLLLPGYQYLSLEDLDTRDYAIRDPRGFLLNYSKGAILDEVQRVPELFSYIQTHTDKADRVGQYVLTGSQNFLLLESITQSLAGRVALLKLLPLSLSELEQANFKINNIEDILFKGSYPRLYSSDVSPAEWHMNYIQTYLERDVRTIKNVVNLNTFQTFLKMCANRAGQLLNLSSLANDCGISHNTANEWVSVLEASFIIFLLKPYYRNYNKRLVKMPKMYFYDSGLLSALLSIQSPAQVENHALKGHLFENFVISELVKKEYNQNHVPNFYFWRDKNGNEIDCLIEKGGKIILIEIKAGKTINSDYFKGFDYWDKLAVKEKVDKYLVYGGDEEQVRTKAKVIGWQSVHQILE